MTDTPALCIPPDPSISGWWWLGDEEGDVCALNWDGENWWVRVPGDYGCQVFRQQLLSREGWRILGPVTTHAEVEALRAEIQRLRKALQAVKDAAAYVDGSLTDCGNIASDALNGGTTP